MPKPHPRRVAALLEWDIDTIRAFAEEMFEDANDHTLSMMMSALRLGEPDLAKGFLDVEIAQEAAGGLSKDLRERRDELMDKLHAAMQENGEDGEEEDDDGDEEQEED
jgi:hypothetical protein